jgi:uncharacterized membrane protein
MASLKTVSMILSTLAVGAGVGVVSNQIVNAGVKTEKEIRSLFWTTPKQAKALEGLITKDLCAQLVISGATKCDEKILRDHEIQLQYLDSNRDGKADNWRISSIGKIKGVFSGE